MRVVTIVGARPQFVKAAPVTRVLRRDHTEVLVHTGQHYDEPMSGALLRDLEMPEPEFDLEVGSGSHAVQTAEMMRRLEPVVISEQPDGILLYGDTNSTLAGALVGCKLMLRGGGRPWLAHVEAGLRSHNHAMPEERNRVVVDHLSDLLLAPTPAAISNLFREGLEERAQMVGDVMADAHAWAASRAKDRLPGVAAELPAYVLLTLHRPENVDDVTRLEGWLRAFAGAGPVIFPVHPRTSAAIDRGGLDLPANIHAIGPVGHLEMVALELNATAVATDSGGVQKEAYLAGVPCLTLRAETEWVETVEVGWNRLVPASAAAVTSALAGASLARQQPRPPIFGDGRAAERIVVALEEMDAARRDGGAAAAQLS